MSRFLSFFVLLQLATLASGHVRSAEDLVKEVEQLCTLFKEDGTVCHNEQFSLASLQSKYPLDVIVEHYYDMGFSRLKALMVMMKEDVCCTNDKCGQKCNPKAFQDPFVLLFPYSARSITDLGSGEIFNGLTRKQLHELKHGRVHGIPEEMLSTLRMRIVEHLDEIYKSFVEKYGKNANPFSYI